MKSFYENTTTLRPYHPEKKNRTPLFNNAPLSNSAPGVGPEKNNSTQGVANTEYTVCVAWFPQKLRYKIGLRNKVIMLLCRPDFQKYPGNVPFTLLVIRKSNK